MYSRILPESLMQTPQEKSKANLAAFLVYSLSWGLDEYQEAMNKGIWQQNIEFVKVRVTKKYLLLTPFRHLIFVTIS